MCRSDPQIAVRRTRRMTSSLSSIYGSGTLLTRTSCGPYQHTACMAWTPSARRGLGLEGDLPAQLEVTLDVAEAFVDHLVGATPEHLGNGGTNASERRRVLHVHEHLGALGGGRLPEVHAPGADDVGSFQRAP